MFLASWGKDVVEYSRTLGWYSARKAAFFGALFETGKGVVVTFLKSRRGTYQKPFLHTGMITLAAIAILGAPILASQYPTAAAANALGLVATTPLVALDVVSSDTRTAESEKPRRDISEYTVKAGDTLSTIAKNFAVDTDSIASLNDIAAAKILKPGEVLKIPPVAGVIVTVKRGDTVASLAKKYGIPSAQPIVDWPYNTFINDETFALAAGQTLVIPGGKPLEEGEAPVAAVRQVRPPALFAPTFGGPFIWPTNGAITQYFSWYHRGLDIANSGGTAVTAADGGRVTAVNQWSFGYGWHVILDHGNGSRTLYAHLSKILVEVGDNVSRGQTIALMGSTGRSTGSHLHFEIYQNGEVVNPLGLLK